MSIERRDLLGESLAIEERADGKKILAGYASVYYNSAKRGDTEYKLWQDMLERISSTAFQRALKEKHDVRALFNHKSDSILGRVSANTLRLSSDNKGLKYEIDLPDTQLGKDVAISVQRGDISGSSFAFNVRGRTIEEIDGVTIRTITDVDLIDVGPVTFPAYTGTTVGMRCHDIESIKTEYENEVSVIRLRENLRNHRKQMLDNCQ